ncbi:zinc finger, CCHC-type containing protein [Tanacetum coccineum]|uniref:Zinc finger, CCHC-type containing protein n=1 Tax=Tanacetum coccineum TaxID=301880 RepID=A0ABQ5FJV3_9ASTR
MKESKAYKTYLGFATGAVPPKVARKFKKASPSKKDSVHVPGDEEPAKGKGKENVDVAHGKGIELSHPGGSGTIAEDPPSVKKITPTVISEGTSDKPGVPDVTNDDSSKRDEGSDQEKASDEQESDSEQDDDDDDDQENEEFDHENESEDDKTKSDEGDQGMDDTTNQVNDDVDTRLEEPTQTTNEIFQREGTEAEMTEAQQGNENLTTNQEQVVEDAHVNISTVPKKTEEIVSPLDVHVHHEVPRSQAPTLLIILVSVIPKSSPVITNIPQSSHTFTPIPIQATPTPPPTIETTNPLSNLPDFASRSREDKDKDEDPSAGSDRGLKKRKTSKDPEPTTTSKRKDSTSGSSKGTKSQPRSSGKSVQSEEPEFEVGYSDMPQDQAGIQDDNADEPRSETVSRQDWFKKPVPPQACWHDSKTRQEGPSQSWLMDLTTSTSKDKSLKDFDELMSTLIDFSSFVLNRLKIDNLTQEILLGLTFKLLKGTRTNYAELEYDFEECYKALSQKLDWYGVSHIGEINAITHVKVMRKHGYEYLEAIMVRRADNVLYKFKKGYFPRLWIKDIKDMLILAVQNRLTNLSGEDVADFKMINVTKPDTTRPDLRKRHPYTPYKDPQGFIYVDDFGRNRLMRTDELYKFSDGTLTRLLTSLNNITNNINMEYLPKRQWSNLEKKRAHYMIKDINKLLKERRLMRITLSDPYSAATHFGGVTDWYLEPGLQRTRFSSVPRPSLRIPNETEDIGGSVVPDEVTEEVVQQPELELRKSKRNRTPKDFGPEFQLYLIKGTRDEVSDQHSYCFNVEDDPKTFDEAMKKLKVDGMIEKFKARLVIQGFKQKSGIDYFDTYAPVARISTIRLLIAMASIHNLIIHQMDVKITFLNGNLDEEVDLIKEFLSLKFSMKDMGEADVILGIRIKHGSNRIAISQSHYIEKVLNKFNYFDCTLVSTPMDTSEKLMPNNGQAVSQLKYSRVSGCLMYAMTCTRPDIAFAIGKVSRYTSNPGTQHWQAIQRVLKYLKKTMDYRLIYWLSFSVGRLQ